MDTPDPLLGVVLDERYALLRVVGRGGSGVVYAARQIKVGREVAVKVLAGDAGDPRRVARFERNARALSELRHPNTLKVIDFGHLPDGRPYLVSPLLQGAPLREILDTEGRLDVRRTLAIVEQVADALVEAHEAGVIHRDLKPENVFVERVAGRNVVRVIDFGIARLIGGEGRLTSDGVSLGTAPYMSPEQVRGEPVDPRSDLYSLGVLAYECLAGHVPFTGRTWLTIVVQHLEEDPPPLRGLAVGPVPAALERLVMACLEKLPDDRPADAVEVRAQVQAVDPDDVTVRLPARRRWPLAVVAVALLGVGWWALRPPPPPAEPVPASRLAPELERFFRSAQLLLHFFLLPRLVFQLPP